MHAEDDELEALVAAALEAFESAGDAGLAAVLATAGPRAEQVRGIVARFADLGLAGGGLVGGTRNGALPERLGDYELRQELGRGGMGVVYEANDTTTGATVAVKLVRPELLADRGARARFRREYAAVARLDHPAIVPVLASGETDGVPWFAMPRLVGRSLADALDDVARRRETGDGTALHDMLGTGDTPPPFQGPWWQVVVRLMAQVAGGLVHAHGHGVLHRDVKPANVLVTADGRALLLDFGLAQVRGATRLTRTGHEPGSPAYMAPEQLRGEPADERTDVYGLAATAWHALTLRSPFGDGDLPELARRIDSGQLVAMPQQVPVALTAVLRRAMDRERAHRHADLAALAADLDAVLAGRTPVVPTLPWRVRWQRAVANHRTAAGAVAALLLLLPIALGGLWWREHQLGTALANEKQRADGKVREFEQLADVVRCDRLVAAAAALLPAVPSKMPELQAWLRDGDALLARRTPLRSVLAELTPRLAENEPSAERFLHTALSKLVLRLDEELQPLRADVQRRLRWAEQVAAASRSHPAARWSWADTRAAIGASPLYGPAIRLPEDGLLGLVPLGPNPATRRFEFYDLASAWDGERPLAAIPLPSHRDDGSIDVTEATGIVFVLLPGGRFAMGAQKLDAAAPQFDALVDQDAPLHDVVLAPFLIARHELTRGQWQRLANVGPPLRDPSIYPTGQTFFGVAMDDRHPVENVSWFEATSMLQRHGMQLPTEAQWEYAARGGTTGPWCVAEALLPSTANVADEACKRIGGANWECEPWSDGQPLHAPVGRLRANAFGLHDVAGNLFEWCRDEFGDYRDPTDGVDGLRESATPRPEGADADVRRARALRGGSWMQLAQFARSAWRNGIGPDQRAREIGLRAVRALPR